MYFDYLIQNFRINFKTASDRFILPTGTNTLGVEIKYRWQVSGRITGVTKNSSVRYR